jgi:hypothetical protein
LVIAPLDDQIASEIGITIAQSIDVTDPLDDRPTDTNRNITSDDGERPERIVEHVVYCSTIRKT